MTTPAAAPPARRVYLDHNATTPLHPAARRAIGEALAALSEDAGNPSSLHAPGRRARDRIEAARAEVAALLGAFPDEIVFTSGGTEANNLALAGARGRVVTTAVEHPSVAEAAGAAALRLPVDAGGRLDLDAVRRALASGAALVSIQWANHETGTLQPIRELAALCRARGVPLHVDAVQAAGKLPIDVHACGVALASLSAHKLGGPPGAGALFVRRSLDLPPLLRGGHQERERRPGTENLLGIVGLGAAARAARDELPDRAARLASLGAALEAGVLAIAGARLVGARDGRAPGTVCVAFAGARGDAIVQALDLAGVAASTGSACSSGSLEPSPVLLAMGLPQALARAAVRLSLGRDSDDADVARALAVLPAVVERVRRFDPAPI